MLKLVGPSINTGSERRHLCECAILGRAVSPSSMSSTGFSETRERRQDKASRGVSMLLFLRNYSSSSDMIERTEAKRCLLGPECVQSRDGDLPVSTHRPRQLHNSARFVPGPKCTMKTVDGEPALPHHQRCCACASAPRAIR